MKKYSQVKYTMERRICQALIQNICDDRPKSCFDCPYSECDFKGDANEQEQEYINIGKEKKIGKASQATAKAVSLDLPRSESFIRLLCEYGKEVST